MDGAHGLSKTHFESIPPKSIHNNRDISASLHPESPFDNVTGAHQQA